MQMPDDGQESKFRMQTGLAGFLLPTRSSGWTAKMDTPALLRDTKVGPSVASRVISLSSFSQLSRLELLPVELLGAVFDQVASTDGDLLPLVDGLSTQLLPFVRRQLYGNLTIRKFSRFAKLCAATQDVQAVRQSTTQLHINMYSWSSKTLHTQRALLYEFLKSTTSLSSLTLQCHEDRLSQFLSVKFSLFCYATLHTLRLPYVLMSPTRILRYIALLPNLKTLDVTCFSETWSYRQEEEELTRENELVLEVLNKGELKFQNNVISLTGAPQMYRSTSLSNISSSICTAVPQRPSSRISSQDLRRCHLSS